jgi:hypothetical protein
MSARNPLMPQLRAAIRSEIGQSFSFSGTAKPRDVARVVCAHHQSMIEALGALLAENEVTNMARGELKKLLQVQDKQTQLHLPGFPESLISLLPTAISIPNGADEEDGTIYKPLAQATLAEIDAHLGLLSQQIAADIRRHRALKELRDMAISMGADEGSRVIDTISVANQPTMAEAA